MACRLRPCGTSRQAAHALATLSRAPHELRRFLNQAFRVHRTGGASAARPPVGRPAKRQTPRLFPSLSAFHASGAFAASQCLSDSASSASNAIVRPFPHPPDALEILAVALLSRRLTPATGPPGFDRLSLSCRLRTSFARKREVLRTAFVSEARRKWGFGKQRCSVHRLNDREKSTRVDFIDTA